MMQPLTAFCSGWEPPRSFLFALLLLLVSIIAPMPGYPTAILALWFAYLSCDNDRIIETRHALLEGIVYTLMLATVLLPALAEPSTIRLYLDLLLVLMFAQCLLLWDSALAGGDTKTFVKVMPLLMLDTVVFFQHETYPTIVQWYALARTLQAYAWTRFWDQHHAARQPYWFDARKQFTPREEVLAWQRAMTNQSFEDVVRSVQIYQERGNVPRIDALKTMFNGLNMTSLLGYLTTAIFYLDTRLEYKKPRQDTRGEPIVLAISECIARPRPSHCHRLDDGTLESRPLGPSEQS